MGANVWRWRYESGQPLAATAVATREREKVKSKQTECDKFQFQIDYRSSIYLLVSVTQMTETVQLIYREFLSKMCTHI